MRSKADLFAAIRRDRRGVLVVNTRSRRGRGHYEVARGLLSTAGFDLLACFGVDQPGQLAGALTAATALRPDLLIAGGGDGTISEAARHLAHRDIALGVLPLGTTNNFARTLGIPLNLPTAITVLTDGKVADVDLGLVGDYPFANLVSVGVSAEVAGHVPAVLKRLLGRGAYPLTALRLLPRHQAFHARITTADQRSRALRTHQVNIANGSFHAGTPITRDASADDRLLLAYALGSHGRRHLLAATLRHILSGRRRTLTAAPFLATDDLWLDTDPPLPLDIDGEIRGHTPVRIRIAPNALRVMVTPDFPDT
ncbi:MAG TPA: YegS/Rv2252/BmrU family lipid kinase [Pseudonocardiaceae bacterium]|jgi:YegS/Rv2252/BmrU family lipid kinase